MDTFNLSVFVLFFSFLLSSRARQTGQQRPVTDLTGTYIHTCRQAGRQTDRLRGKKPYGFPTESVGITSLIIIIISQKIAGAM